MSLEVVVISDRAPNLEIAIVGEFATSDYSYEEGYINYPGYIELMQILKSPNFAGYPVQVNLLSQGGSVAAAEAFAGLVGEHGKCLMVGYGLNASAATFLMMSAKKCRLARGASMLIHDASVWAGGNKQKHTAIAGMLAEIDARIADKYVYQIGLVGKYPQGSEDACRKQMQVYMSAGADGEGTTFTGLEAFTIGLVDEYVDDSGSIQKQPKVKATPTEPIPVITSTEQDPTTPEIEDEFASFAADLYDTARKNQISKEVVNLVKKATESNQHFYKDVFNKQALTQKERERRMNILNSANRPIPFSITIQNTPNGMNGQNPNTPETKPTDATNSQTPADKAGLMEKFFNMVANFFTPAKAEEQAPQSEQQPTAPVNQQPAQPVAQAQPVAPAQAQPATVQNVQQPTPPAPPAVTAKKEEELVIDAWKGTQQQQGTQQANKDPQSNIRSMKELQDYLNACKADILNENPADRYKGNHELVKALEKTQSFDALQAAPVEVKNQFKALILAPILSATNKAAGLL